MKSNTILESKANINNLLLFAVFLFCWGLLILISGLKPIGFDPDSINYVAVLKYKPSDYSLLVFEPLHWVLVYLNNIFFGSNPHTFFTLYALIFLSLSFYSIYRYSISPLISLLIFLALFFPNYGLIQIRQGVVVALLLYSIKDVEQNKLKPFLIKLIIATGFHYSSPIFFISLYLAKKIKLTNVFIALVPIFCLIIGREIRMLPIFYYLSKLIGGGIGYKLQNYLLLMETEGEKISINMINPFNSYTLLMYGIGILFLYLYRKDMDVDKRIMLNTLFFGLSFWFLFVQLPVLSFRLFYPLSIVSIFIFPYLINKVKPYDVSVVLLLFLLLIVSFNMYIRHGLFNFDIVL